MIDKFINIFEGLSSAYGQFRKDNNRLAVKVEGKSFIVKEPVTKELWQNHLNGTGPNLGIFPLTREGTCKWGAIDIDVNNFDYEDLLNRIRKKKLPLIMFRSKSGRAHVYMFMKDFTPAQEVQLVMKKFAAKLGLANMLDRVYPMQTSLGKNDFGSWLNMPYYNQEETSTCAYKDNFDGATIEEFFEMYDKYVQTDLSQHLVEEVKQNIKKPKEKTLEDFLLPCTKNCLKLNNNKIPDENRNDYLLHMYTWSMRAVEKGVKKIPEYSKMDAETLLKYFNQEYMARPVEEKEIQNTVFKSKDKEYKYLCKKPTITKYCDSSACTRHVCGITPLDAEKLVKATQALGKITKYLSEPPIFFESVDVKNENGSGYKRIRIEMQGEDIINKQKWLNKLANQGCFPHISLHEQKSSDFLVMQYERLENCLNEAADEEASEDFEFKSIIYSFVNKMTVSYNKEDLLKNACYVNKDTHELDFKLPNLMEYLKSNHIKIPANQLTLKLKKIMGAKKVNGTVYDEVLDKQKSYPTWRFKSDTDKYVVQITGSAAKQIEHDQEN
jgi:hypothetical protein